MRQLHLSTDHWPPNTTLLFTPKNRRTPTSLPPNTRIWQSSPPAAKTPPPFLTNLPSSSRVQSHIPRFCPKNRVFWATFGPVADNIAACPRGFASPQTRVSMITDCHTHIWQSPEQLGDGALAELSRPALFAGQKMRLLPQADTANHLLACEPADRTFVLGFKSKYLGAAIPNEYIADITAPRTCRSHVRLCGHRSHR